MSSPKDNKIFEILVSSYLENGLKREIYIRFAQLIYTSKYPACKVTKYNKFEIISIRQEESPNKFTLSVPVKVFNWFIECIENELNNNIFKHAIFQDLSKFYTWIKVNEEYSQLVNTSDCRKCFGLFLSTEEKHKIFDFSKKIKLILTYDPQEKLFNISKSLYISVISEAIRQEIKTLCTGCQDERAAHDCKSRLSARFDKYILLDHAISTQNNDYIYNQKFNSLLSLLNISPVERAQHEINLSMLKSNKDNLLNECIEWIDNKKSEIYNFDYILQIPIFNH
jgi:hypothetical protein